MPSPKNKIEVGDIVKTSAKGFWRVVETGVNRQGLTDGALRLEMVLKDDMQHPKGKVPGFAYPDGCTVLNMEWVEGAEEEAIEGYSRLKNIVEQRENAKRS